MPITLSGIAEQIWNDKYRFTGNDEFPADTSVEDTFRRVAKAVASAEATPALREEWEEKFYSIMENFEFIPAGRILAGAGTGRKVTLLNCFVAGTIHDSIGGIFQSIREAAETIQQGGGIGFNFSTIRPKGALVKGIGADASGPLSFMDTYDAACKTVMSAAGRRGAMMAVLDISHPDIEEFIEAKQTPGRLTMFNLSVAVSDRFMLALAGNEPWDLSFEGKVYRTIPAKQLWEKLTRATYDYAEPGVLFIDKINQMNNLWYCETLSATNPCGEQPLPYYGACLLGSINLAALIKHPFSDNSRLDTTRLNHVTAIAVRLLDNVHDITNFPLEAQRAESQSKRRIGLGVTGLADALTMLEIRYGTEEAASTIALWLNLIAMAAYRESCKLSLEKGSFPAYDKEQYLASRFFTKLPRSLIDLISSNGIRNSHLTSIAPTGTISLFAGNISSGIEPTFAHRYERKVLNKDGTHRTEIVESPSLKLYREKVPGNAPLPDYFVTATQLTPAEHITMQAEAQLYVDSSISKTVNCPVDILYEDFQKVYDLAYEVGLKGCATYRPSPVRGSVLSEIKEEKPVEGKTPTSTALTPRPAVLQSTTYKLKPPVSEHALYITISTFEENGKLRPYEIFFNSKNVEHYAWNTALARMISAVFRRGGAVAFVADELKEVFDPKGGFWADGRYVPSLLAAIGVVIEQHLKGLASSDEVKAIPVQVATAGKLCPKCFQPLQVSEGCEKCVSCGYSKCG